MARTCMPPNLEVAAHRTDRPMKATIAEVGASSQVGALDPPVHVMFPKCESISLSTCREAPRKRSPRWQARNYSAAKHPMLHAVK